MSEVYAQNVDRINDTIANYKESQLENFDALAQGASATFSQAQKDYSDKWDTALTSGGEALASQFGIRTAYKAGTKGLALYSKYKGKAKGKSSNPDEGESEGGNLSKTAEEETGAKFKAEGSEVDSALTNSDEGIAQVPKSLGTKIFKGGMPKSRTPTSEPSRSTLAEDEPTEFGTSTATDSSAFGSVGADQTPGAVSSSFQGSAQADPAQLIGQQAKAAETLPKSVTDVIPEKPTTTLGAEGDSGIKTLAMEGEEQEGSSLIGKVGSSIFKNLAGKGRTIKSGLSSVKSYFSGAKATVGDAGEAVGEAAGTAVGEGAGEAAGATVGEAVLGAIPVVGEIGLFVGGIVSIGEAIYHLFHPEAKPPPPKPPSVTVPKMLTAKMTSALPSYDSSADVGGSMNSF